jgi:hypothetical protein
VTSGLRQPQRLGTKSTSRVRDPTADLVTTLPPAEILDLGEFTAWMYGLVSRVRSVPCVLTCDSRLDLDLFEGLLVVNELDRLCERHRAPALSDAYREQGTVRELHLHYLTVIAMPPADG